jgi:hypothetical protein
MAVEQLGKQVEYIGASILEDGTACAQQLGRVACVEQCDDCPGIYEDGCCMADLAGNDPDAGHENDPTTCKGCPGLGAPGCCSEHVPFDENVLQQIGSLGCRLQLDFVHQLS